MQPTGTVRTGLSTQFKLRYTVAIMAWPTPQEYNEAIQNPRLNFRDEQLRSCSVALNEIRLPRVASGNFASVYKLMGGQQFAVRCFLHDVTDLAGRYKQISEFIMNDELPYTVAFEFIQEGLLVNGNCYPILKMEWIDGMPLDLYVLKFARVAERMERIANLFFSMIADLRQAGISHCDLQHGNILVINDGSELRLVDYDNMFVPALNGMHSNELGHSNYQHPQRARNDFNASLDNFSAWSIYTSMICLARDGNLLEYLHGGDECLLFRQTDYQKPLQSRTFFHLEGHSDSRIVQATRRFRSIVSKTLQEVPVLDDIDNIDVGELPPLNFEAIALWKGTSMWLGVESPQIEVSQTAHDAKSGVLQSGLDAGHHYSQRISAANASDWPQAVAIFRAVQEPATAFNAETGLNRSRLGKFTHFSPVKNTLIVDVDDGSRHYAVKALLDANEEQVNHLQELSEKLKHCDYALTSYLIKMDVFSNGLVVDGTSYPIQRMQWYGGRTLRESLKELNSSRSILSENWWLDFASQARLMLHQMRTNQLIHGDFEPGNLMIWGGYLKLLDYDTMRLRTSSLTNFALPLESYRHPLWRIHGAPNDEFSAWVLDCTIVCLISDPSLMQYKRPNGDLFDADDFAAPERSPVLSAMLKSQSLIVRNRAALLKVFCKLRPHEIPPLRMDTSIPSRFAALHGLWFHPGPYDMVSPDAAEPKKLPVQTTKTTAVTSINVSPGLVQVIVIVALIFCLCFMAMIGRF
jgi:tRNA A-37 threonylcarbamoyl transferase component Bud32